MRCENGKALSIFENFCHGCPLGSYSTFAMSSNCSKRFNNFCPMYYSSSKICMDKVNVPMNCSAGGLHQYWKCPKAIKGPNFDQCYDMYV